LGAALTIFIMITITAIACTVIWLSRWGTVKRRAMETVTVQQEPTVTEGRRFDWLLVYMVLYLLFLYIPSAMLPIFSFNDSIQMVLPLKEFTVRWYVDLAEKPALLKALGNSLKVAFPVAIVTTTLATFAAKALSRYRLPGRSLAIGFILLPMVMPGIIMAVGILVIALAVGVPLSLWVIGVSHVVVTVPFATLVVMARLEGFSKNIEESSLDLGIGPWMTFWRITFPLILPGLGAAFLLTFTASFDEFLLALFLGGSKVTLPVYMFSQVRFPQTLPTALALGALIFMVSVVLVVLAMWLRRLGTQPMKNT
jgi:spermidine/putrescine transport system permease protein